MAELYGGGTLDHSHHSVYTKQDRDAEYDASLSFKHLNICYLQTRMENLFQHFTRVLWPMKTSKPSITEDVET